MNRRELLRTCGSAFTAAGAVGLSGCSGGDGTGGTTTGTTQATTSTTTWTATSTATQTTTRTTTQATTETTARTTMQTTTQATQTTTRTTQSDQYVREDRGAIRSNTVDELRILGWTSRAEDREFVVTLSVENTGSEETELVQYWYEVHVFDDSGSELETEGWGQNATDTSSPGPGEVGTVAVETILASADPATVARYEVVLNCTFSSGVYCQSEE